MSTSPNSPHTGTWAAQPATPLSAQRPPASRNRRSLAILLGVVAGIAILALVGVLLWRGGYDTKATEPVVASLAKTDTAAQRSIPNCEEGEWVYNLAVNGPVLVFNGEDRPEDVPLWSVSDDVSATGIFDAQSGVLGDIAVTAKLKKDKDGNSVPVLRVTKTYAWNLSITDKGEPSWSVARYVTPGPTGTLTIKDSGLGTYGELMVCAIITP